MLTVTGVAHKNKNELQGTWYTSHWVWLCIRPQNDPPNLSIVTDLQHCTILCRLIWYFQKNEPYMCEEAYMSSSKRTCVIRRGTASIFRSFSKRPLKCLPQDKSQGPDCQGQVFAVLGLVQSRDIPRQNGDKDGEDTSWLAMPPNSSNEKGYAVRNMYRIGCWRLIVWIDRKGSNGIRYTHIIHIYIYIKRIRHRSKQKMTQQ